MIRSLAGAARRAISVPALALALTLAAAPIVRAEPANRGGTRFTLVGYSGYAPQIAIDLAAARTDKERATAVAQAVLAYVFERKDAPVEDCWREGREIVVRLRKGAPGHFIWVRVDLERREATWTTCRCPS